MPTGVFELNSTRDLLGKLRSDLDRLRNDPTDAYAAFDFFVTAFHLSDWAYASDSDSKKACRSNILMKVCASLANNGKHFYRGRESVVAESKQHSGIFDREVFDPEIFDTDCLMVRLEPDAATEYGHESISVLTLARQLLEFWEQRVA